MSDKIVSISGKRVSETDYRGLAYSIVRTEGRWRVRMVMPLRPAKFERTFDDRKKAEEWIRSIIDGMVNVDE
jgi:hypothetical protein